MFFDPRFDENASPDPIPDPEAEGSPVFGREQIHPRSLHAAMVSLISSRGELNFNLNYTYSFILEEC